MQLNWRGSNESSRQRKHQRGRPSVTDLDSPSSRSPSRHHRNMFRHRSQAGPALHPRSSLFLRRRSHNARQKYSRRPPALSLRLPEFNQSSAKCLRVPNGSILKGPSLPQPRQRNELQKTRCRVRATALLRGGMRFAACLMPYRYCPKLHLWRRQLALRWWLFFRLQAALERPA